MNKFSLLNRIKYLYEQENVNITQYLKSLSNQSTNSIEDIQISYDFQSGSYTQYYQKNPTIKERQLSELIRILNEQLDPCETILEVGIGEATSFANILTKLNYKYKVALGFDLSWSRIKYAKKFLQSQAINQENIQLFTADLFNIPLQDNSINLVYTVHAIEPNGGREKEAIQELYRVSNKYLVLVEPYYEGASVEAQQQMEKKGYVKGIAQTINELGYKLIINTPLINDLNPLNPCNIFVIEKEVEESTDCVLSCPVTKTKLEKLDSCYYSEESLLAYPILEGIPCLSDNNSIVATKMK